MTPRLAVHLPRRHRGQPFCDNLEQGSTDQAQHAIEIRMDKPSRNAEVPPKKE
ncbi:MAG: hypothetical protein H6718_15010 [Polyangiaceae bacterium]|nr:hypothetical protein [Myxococcales bacterium]MCB9586708.1 hypothetical protein [Polyangiaceae bacterium]MCB9606215.1 hypothetical protein [Polyangiaceae bacterium]